MSRYDHDHVRYRRGSRRVPARIMQAFRNGDSIAMGEVDNLNALLAEIPDHAVWDGRGRDREFYIHIDHALRQGYYPVPMWTVLPAVVLAVVTLELSLE